MKMGKKDPRSSMSKSVKGKSPVNPGGKSPVTSAGPFEVAGVGERTGGRRRGKAPKADPIADKHNAV